MTERQPRLAGAPFEPPADSYAARDQTPRIVYDTERHQLIAHGVLDYAFTQHLDDILRAALADHPKRIVLDLTDVWILDASTTRLLRAYQAQTTATGCAFHITGAAGVVRHVLELTGVLPPAEQPRTANQPTPASDR